MLIPSMLLKKLYTIGSLRNANGGVEFSIKNRLSDAEFAGLRSLGIDGREAQRSSITLLLKDGRTLVPDDVTPQTPLAFPLRETLTIRLQMPPLGPGRHEISIAFEARPFGSLRFTVEDAISEAEPATPRIPRHPVDDYTPEMVGARQAFVAEMTGSRLEHIRRFSFDPHLVKGNCENFTGVAQVPLGFAGPLQVNGEHAQGEFMIPLATTEGTLVASYNRGMKLLNLSGGVKCTVVADAMQRAPVFVFDDARAARDFVAWVNANLPRIKEEAEATSKVARLQEIDPYLANKFAFLRFNYTTGDAAGQNMVGRATFAACSWLIDNYPNIRRFYLESNFATDKKASQVNIMRTRGKRVTAVATIKREVLVQHMRVEPATLAYHAGVANIGAFMSHANNNGLHSANGIAAMFIATGQDVANVAESSAGIIYSELTPEGDLYLSLTIPSLIVATYGGGTGLPTQRECLELLGCWGKDKVYRLAEIIAGVALAGEISLAAAISSSDWVSSHETYGRNR